ncbi:HD domain-containing protein [Actinomycetes bacterium KLBMP 9797]
MIPPDLARALDADDSFLRPLPDQIVALLVDLRAPARLAAHLRAVHDVAWHLTTRLATSHPSLVFDPDAVHYGAASHDIGKVIHPGELSGPGSQHEPAGYALLVTRDVPHRLARFARTHASWTDPDTTIDDHLVSLADKIWKAKRVPDLEDLITTELAAACGLERWQAFTALDDILDELAAGADDRLAYQTRHPV